MFFKVRDEGAVMTKAMYNIIVIFFELGVSQGLRPLTYFSDKLCSLCAYR
jgi:hypothetical protein